MWQEFWKADEKSAICFRQGEEWFHIESGDNADWQFKPVTMERGLPAEMNQAYYREITSEQFYSLTQWSSEELGEKVRQNSSVAQ